MASRQARTFVLAAAVLVGVTATFVCALATPETPEAPPPLPAAHEAPPGPEPTPLPAAPTPAAATPAPTGPTSRAPEAGKDRNAIDLFAGEMPEWMSALHARASAGRPLDIAQQKQLYEFGQQHENDARPQLLLAWDSMNREWWGFAVRLYASAYDADPRAREDPTMLRDLVEIASRHDRTEGRESTALIVRAYGNEALPRIDSKTEELRRAGDLTRVDRLDKLRRMIEEK